MLKTKIIGKELKINKNETQTTTQIYKEKGKLHVKDIRKIVDKIKEAGRRKYGDGFKVPLIKVLNGEKWARFDTEDKFNDYYEGKVANPDKFDSFFQIQITTVAP